MTSPKQGAGMILGAVPHDGAEAVIASYVQAGIRAFLFPGILLVEPERLSGLAAEARRLVALAGTGPALVALGGWEEASASFPMVPDLPSPLCLAASQDRHLARHAGFLLGHAASGAGVDLVMGPRLDLATDPKARGGIMDLFGEDPHAAARLGAAFARGLARGGVAACGLSFPGCGSLSLDARREPATLPFAAERLAEAEERPFARAIKAGLAALLVARAYVPAYDQEHIPAARSSLAIEGRLRSALGFRGLVIGGALDEDPEKPGRAALLGALAGCDFSLALDPDLALEAAAGLEAAVREGEIPSPRPIIQSRRLEALLSDLASPPLRTRTLPLYASPLVAGFAARTAELGATLLRGPRWAGSGHGRESRHDARRDARRLSRYANPEAAGRGPGPRFRPVPGLVPPLQGLPVLLFMPPSASGNSRRSSALLAALREELPGARIFSLPADPSEGDAMAVLSEVIAPGPASAAGGGRGDAVASGSDGKAGSPGTAGSALVLSCDAHLRPSQESFIHVLEESLEAVSIIALRDPYDAAFFPRAAAIGAVYGDSEASIRAAARLALGRIEARGRCPVRVLGIEV